MGVYRYGASFVLKIPTGKRFLGGVHLDPRCAQTGVKSSLGTEVLNQKDVLKGETMVIFNPSNILFVLYDCC